MSDVFKTLNYEIESQMETSKSLAPIVLFVYNRPWHTQQTIEALQQNELASDSELFIYSDGAKTEKDASKVQAVRSYIQAVDLFKKVTVIERQENWGLANSIIDGVTTIVNQYGKIIVLEDDLVTSPFFLNYMNDGLEFYKSESKVMNISGFNYPIDSLNIPETFLFRGASCWSWATWASAWEFFQKDPDHLYQQFSKKDKFHLNYDGNAEMWSQVIANKKNKINTWAIFWYANIYLQKGLCLHPAKSLVRNIGHDGSGIHCGKDFLGLANQEINQRLITFFNTDLNENKIACQYIFDFLKSKKRSFFTKVKDKLIKSLT